MFSFKNSLMVLCTAGMCLTLCAAGKHKIQLSLDKSDGNKTASCPVNIEENYPDGTKKVTFFPAKKR